MNGYSLDTVKQLIQNNDFDNLNILLTEMVNNETHTLKDIEILKYLLDSENIAVQSKQNIKVLYLKYKKEIEERIFSGNNNVKITPYTDNFDLKPSEKKEDDFAFVSFKSVVLIISLTILVIAAVSFLTIRG